MDLENIVAELKAEIVRITHAIGLLEGNGTPKRRVGRPPGSVSAKAQSRRGGGMTAAGRRALSEAMKRRWAQRRNGSGADLTTTSSSAVAKPKKKGRMSAAGRRSISLAMKKRWAEKQNNS